MLRIRKEQMTELSRVAVEDFVDRVRDYLRQARFAETAAMPDAELDALTRAALDRAPRYGMDSEAHVARFTELLVELGPAFDRSPEATTLLLDTDLDPDEKLDAVLALPLHRPLALEEAS